MNNYSIKEGDTISDVALNGCGTIKVLFDILEQNSFEDCNPKLIAGQKLNIPNVKDFVFYRELVLHPACNNTQNNLENLLNDISALIESTTITSHLLPKYDTKTTNLYTVKEGETVNDIVLNLTGSLTNIDAFLDENGFEDWAEKLYAGQIVKIPNIETPQTNVIKSLEKYPACNLTNINNIDFQISEIITNFSPPNKEFEDDIIFDFEDGNIIKFQNA